MNSAEREQLCQFILKRSEEFSIIGPTAAKRLARARFLNANMARYTDKGDFVWMPQYGGPEIPNSETSALMKR